MSLRRRDFFMGALISASPLLKAAARPKHAIIAMQLFEVKVSERGNWLFVRLRTDKGLTGLGEASHGLIGVGLAPRDADASTKAMLGRFFALVRGESPFDIEQYRTRGWKLARDGGRPGNYSFQCHRTSLVGFVRQGAGCSSLRTAWGQDAPGIGSIRQHQPGNKWRPISRCLC